MLYNRDIFRKTITGFAKEFPMGTDDAERKFMHASLAHILTCAGTDEFPRIYDEGVGIVTDVWRMAYNR